MTEQKLTEIETQIQLFNSVASEVKNSSKDFSQVIPSDVGLSDATASSLINKYNELVLERNRLLRSASVNSPVVEPLTDQVRILNANIRRAIETARNNLQIQKMLLLDNLISIIRKYLKLLNKKECTIYRIVSNEVSVQLVLYVITKT